jgi:hypothetical protein
MGEIGLRAMSLSPILSFPSVLFIYLPPVRPLHKAPRGQTSLIIFFYFIFFVNQPSTFPRFLFTQKFHHKFMQYVS